MENLNAEQIIKALECCASGSGISACESGCPLWDKDKPECIDDSEYILKLALALIKELTEENEKLYHLVDDKIQEIKKLTEENEKLKAQKYYIHSDGRIEMVPTVESVRSDTVRKMHFEIQQRCIKRGIYPLLVGYTLDQVAYEITGDDYFKPRFMLDGKDER